MMAGFCTITKIYVCAYQYLQTEGYKEATRLDIGALPWSTITEIPVETQKSLVQWK